MREYGNYSNIKHYCYETFISYLYYIYCPKCASGIHVKNLQRTRAKCKPLRPGQRLQLPRDFCVIEYNTADATEAQQSPLKKVSRVRAPKSVLQLYNRTY